MKPCIIEIIGNVVKGDGISTNEFTVPTANISLNCTPDLEFGVYAAEIIYDGSKYYGALCWGAGRSPKFEVHIFGLNKDLVGQELAVRAVQKVNELVDWRSKEQMKQKIFADLDLVRKYFKI